MTPCEVAQLYRNQGREVPTEFRSSDEREAGIAAIAAPREKYGRKKCTVDGKQFDSTGEALAWQLLSLWGKAGIITDLEVQPEFELEPGFVVDGKKVRAIKYRADFIFTKDGRRTVVDFKGFPTAAFKIKQKMFRARFPQLVFEVWNAAKVRELSRL
jgi:hypothetical protein